VNHTQQIENPVIHRSNDRGYADYGWLKTYHTFNFGNYYHPQRRRFGTLRVLNDDTVAPGMGFDTHAHDNMEIISIPLSGGLEHRDSMGHTTVINTGDVQVMSAGTGITHSEYNHSKTAPVSFLQIWLLPNQQDVVPRYQQKTFAAGECGKRWQLLVSGFEEEDALFVHQHTRIFRGNFSKSSTIALPKTKSDAGGYLFAIEGAVQFGDTRLEKRDGAGWLPPVDIALKCMTDTNLLFIETPIHLTQK
jgi:redox-sensitive bicupin YhaK (pirin superfamily)